MPDFTGRRRKQSMMPSNLTPARTIVLFVAVLAVLRLLTLPEPARPAAAPVQIPLTVVPNWTGPAPVGVPGQIADGAVFTPRLYMTAQDSVGIAATPDNAYWRVMLRGEAGQVTEIRRVLATELPQFDGFAIDGDTLVWAESTTRSGAQVRTTLWRSNWRTGVRATQITSNTGEASFLNRAFDIVVSGGRVFWAAVGTPGQTEIRSVALTGGTVSIKKLGGQFALAAAPWAVSLTGGRGQPVLLVNLSTGEQIKVGTSAAEIANCDPTRCLIAVLGPNNELARIDLQQPDGTGRRRIAGNEATPTITDVAMLDRYVPLKTDRSGVTESAGADGDDTGLSLYDITDDSTQLVASGVSNIQAYGGMLWWSTGAGPDLVWQALDLRTAS